jgi:hypothetical protein
MGLIRNDKSILELRIKPLNSVDDLRRCMYLYKATNCHRDLVCGLMVDWSRGQHGISPIEFRSSGCLIWESLKKR